MKRRRTRCQCHNFLVLSDKTSQVFFKTIHIGTKWHHPVRVEGFVYEPLLVAAHVGETEIDAFSFHCDWVVILLTNPLRMNVSFALPKPMVNQVRALYNTSTG